MQRIGFAGKKPFYRKNLHIFITHCDQTIAQFLELLAPLETRSSWSPFTAVSEVETSAVGGTAGDLLMFWPNCCWELLWLKDGLEEDGGIVCLFSPGDIVGCVADSSEKKHYSYIIVQGPIHPQSKHIITLSYQIYFMKPWSPY